MKSTVSPFSIIRPLVICFSLLPLAALAQGSLTPPGGPGPTGKALQQIEPRTDVLQLSGDANNVYIISSPGSYYLTTNIAVSTIQSGISIRADNVTLDLNGFALIGSSVSLAGIVVPAAQKDLAIFGGTIRGWGKDGIAATNATAGQFERLRVTDNGAQTLNAGSGIRVGIQSRLHDCLAQGNSNDGIFVDLGSAVEHCSVIGNHNNGITTGVANIATVNGCKISDCLAVGNLGIGIAANGNATITGCTVGQNQTTGIAVNSFCSVMNNTVTGNTVDGIQTTGLHNHLEGNTSLANGVDGIHSINGASSFDIIVRNIAYDNASANYAPATGVVGLGPVVTPASATNSAANLQGN